MEPNLSIARPRRRGKDPTSFTNTCGSNTPPAVVIVTIGGARVSRMVPHPQYPGMFKDVPATNWQDLAPAATEEVRSCRHGGRKRLALAFPCPAALAALAVWSEEGGAQ